LIWAIAQICGYTFSGNALSLSTPQPSLTELGLLWGVNPAFTPQRFARRGDMPGYSHPRLAALGVVWQFYF
jgi:hypothetical protein